MPVLCGYLIPSEINRLGVSKKTVLRRKFVPKRKLQEAKENCMASSFVICTLVRRACSTRRRDDMHGYKFLDGTEEITWKTKMPVFWDVAPCSLVEINRRFRSTCFLHHHHPQWWRHKHLWNVGQFLPDYTEQHLRRQSSSYSPPWELEISRGRP
jgi:hypothetical protein